MWFSADISLVKKVWAGLLALNLVGFALVSVAQGEPVDTGSAQAAGWSVQVSGVGSVTLVPQANAAVPDPCPATPPCEDHETNQLLSATVGSALNPTAQADALQSTADAYKDDDGNATLQSVMQGASPITLPSAWNTRAYSHVSGFRALNGSIRADTIEAEAVSGTRMTGGNVVRVAASGARVVNLRFANALATESLAPIVPDVPNQVLFDRLGIRIVYWETNWEPATASTPGNAPVTITTLHITTTTGIDIHVAQTTADSIYTPPVVDPDPTPTDDPDPDPTPTDDPDPDPTPTDDPDPDPTPTDDPDPDPTPTDDPDPDPTPTDDPDPDPTPTDDPDPDPTPTDDPDPDPTPTDDPDPDPTPTDDPDPDPTPTDDPDPDPTPTDDPDPDPTPTDDPDPDPTPTDDPDPDPTPTDDPDPDPTPTDDPDPDPSVLPSPTGTSADNPPVAENDFGLTPQDTPIVIGVVPNDSDPDGDLDPASVSLVDPPTNGTASCADGVCTYTPGPGYTGADQFTYEVCDFAGNCDTAQVTVNITGTPDPDPDPDPSPTATTDPDPTPTGNPGGGGGGAGPNPPDARDDSTSTRSGVPVVLGVTPNDSDPDDDLDPSSVTVIDPPKHGTVDCHTGTCTYTPDDGYTGEDFFTYKICDMNGACDVAKVNLTVFGDTVNGGSGIDRDDSTTDPDGSSNPSIPERDDGDGSTPPNDGDPGPGGGTGGPDGSSKLNAAPVPALPFTGGNSIIFLAVAMNLVVIGGFMMLTDSRRRLVIVPAAAPAPKPIPPAPRPASSTKTPTTEVRARGCAYSSKRKTTVRRTPKQG